MQLKEATEFLTAIEPGQRVSLWDPHAVNHPGQWKALFVLPEEPQPTHPYTPKCLNRQHFRLYMRLWQQTVCFVSNLCACELAEGSKRLTVWDMPTDATHSVSQTCFSDPETGRTWLSSQCGVLLETTGGRLPHREGHRYYPQFGAVPDSLTCPGCRMRNGMRPETCRGVTRLA
ncbi:hypothetical protein [Streptomyces sp. NPDC058595]|uniref:hypothetical protein n=1 Tax=Streptomyces sp. NPDC058595 TaxID=3346550 RepID=UPI00364F9E66